MTGYLFKELRGLGIHGFILIFFSRMNLLRILNFLVNLNFFGEKHGKNARDTHFSCLSLFVKNESLVTPIKNTGDIIIAIHNRQVISNRSRALRGY